MDSVLLLYVEKTLIDKIKSPERAVDNKYKHVARIINGVEHCLRVYFKYFQFRILVTILLPLRF